MIEKDEKENELINNLYTIEKCILLYQAWFQNWNWKKHACKEKQICFQPLQYSLSAW